VAQRPNVKFGPVDIEIEVSEDETVLAEEVGVQEDAGVAPVGIDEELSRKHEEFKRERLGGEN